MRQKIDQVAVFASRVSTIRSWKATKKVAMNHKNVERCAKDLKISSACVRDAMNVAGIRYTF